MSDRIDSHAPSGFRDLLPRDAQVRQSVMDRIKAVFERFGFIPLDTPALEREEVLTGGDPAFAKQIYRARITEDDEPLALRFDLTVPLARFIAAHADKLTFPLARYHMGNVWRGEHAQAGRYRQFVQCDADIVGGRAPVADAQTLALAYAVFAELGLAQKVSMRISDRRILGSLAEFLEFDPKFTPVVLRAIDKMDKQGWDSVALELKNKCGLDTAQIDGIQELLDLKGDTPEALLDQAHLMLQHCPSAHAGVEALRSLITTLDALRVPRDAWSLDLSIARGLGYYTGMVFETTLTGLPQYGSVCSGGRYDDLVARFSPLKLSGVGMSLGLDRLLAALDELNVVFPSSGGPKLALLDFEPTARADVLGLAGTLREAGISTALYVGPEETLKGQLSWAVKMGFPYVAIMGASEKANGVVQLKEMVARTQEEVPFADLPKRLTA